MKRRDIFQNTKRKVVVISTAIVFLCLLIFAIITKTLYTTRVFNNIDKQLVDQKRIMDNLTNGKGYLNEFVIGERVGVKPPPIPPNFIVLIYKGQELYFLSPNSYFDVNNLPVFEEGYNDKIYKISDNGYQFRGINFINKDFTVQFLINVDSEIQSINQLMNSIILSLLMLIIVALILSYFLSSKIIKPIKDAYDKQVFFVQDASHEMRTPLAVIKGKLELLANSWGDTIETHFEHISKIMSEVRGLEKLNGDLLLLSKEDIDLTINTTNVNVFEFIQDISSFYFDLAQMQEKNFQVKNINKDVIVKWDYNKIKRMIIILLENAFKYTEFNGNITLKVDEIGKNIKISVIDTGIGINEGDKKRIFDRFYRSSNVRGKNIPGSGIGLSLLKSISNTLGVKIKLTSELGVGTNFTLIIPKIIK